VRRGDRWLIALPLALTAIGLVMVYSSSAILGITRFQDADHYMMRQLQRIGLGLLGLFACSRLPLRWLERWAPWLLGSAVSMLALVVVVGRVSKGAMRWLSLGFFTLQPTDLARLAAVVFLAWMLRRRPPAEHGFWRGTMIPLGVVGTLSGLILLQPNLSSAMLLGMTGFAMLFLGGARLRHLAVPVAAGAAFMTVALLTHPYQMQRVETFVRFLVSGELDARGTGWQLDQSLIAIGSGGWFGRGIGGGLQKFLFLPEAHTDFIFSILAEETGLFGATILLVLIGLLVWRGMRVASRASDPFTYLLAGGLTIQIALYALVNLSVATGIAPTTGLPLPFVSYGGSALVANLMAAGLLYRISAVNGTDEALTRQRWSQEAA
jgi:cell division protein FtsW